MKDLEGYAQWMEGKQKAKRTIDNYLFELRKLPEEFEAQHGYIREHHKVRMLISAYRSYLRYLKHIGFLTRAQMYDYLDAFERPKRRGQTQTGRAFAIDQWGDIIRAAPNRSAKMGIWLGFNFGLRLSEIVYLRIRDIDLPNKIIRITGKNREDGWHPKHFRERILPINPEQVEVFELWIKQRPRGLEHDYLLWIERNGLQVKDRTFQRWCQKAHSDLRPHDLRRSYATALYYRTDKDVKAVQLALGHSNVGTTSNYLRLDETEYLEKIRLAMT